MELNGWNSAGSMFCAYKAIVEEHIPEGEQSGVGTFVAGACLAHWLVGWCQGDEIWILV